MSDVVSLSPLLSAACRKQFPLWVLGEPGLSRLSQDRVCKHITLNRPCSRKANVAIASAWTKRASLVLKVTLAMEESLALTLGLASKSHVLLPPTLTMPPQFAY